jgi:HAD superfamily hydrolase (TIGR01509 family)
VIRALIFDFDGVILDTETTLYECWRETYEAHGCCLTKEEWAANIGGSGYDTFNPFDALAQRHGREVDWEPIHAARRERYNTRVWEQGCMPGVEPLLQAARAHGLSLAVASSSNDDWVHGHLKRLGLYDYFDTTACGNEVPAIKPAPFVYQLALERLGLQPEEAIALEDSAKGLEAAKAAGLCCVSVTNPVTELLELAGTDLRLPSLADVSLHQILAAAKEGALCNSNPS